MLLIGPRLYTYKPDLFLSAYHACVVIFNKIRQFTIPRDKSYDHDSSMTAIIAISVAQPTLFCHLVCTERATTATPVLRIPPTSTTASSTAVLSVCLSVLKKKRQLERKHSIQISKAVIGGSIIFFLLTFVLHVLVCLYVYVAWPLFPKISKTSFLHAHMLLGSKNSASAACIGGSRSVIFAAERKRAVRCSTLLARSAPCIFQSCNSFVSLIFFVGLGTLVGVSEKTSAVDDTKRIVVVLLTFFTFGML